MLSNKSASFDVAKKTSPVCKGAAVLSGNLAKNVTQELPNVLDYLNNIFRSGKFRDAFLNMEIFGVSQLDVPGWGNAKATK